MDQPRDQETVPDSGQAEPSAAHATLAADDDGGFAQRSSAFPTGQNSSLPADGRAWRYWVWAVCGFLLLAVGLVFGQTARHEFLGWDDSGFVYRNPQVAPGLTLPGLWYALTDGPYGEWTPLSTLSHMLDCQLYGLKPAGHHLTNVLLHAASSVLLFLVLLRMTGDFWPSAWVAAVFAIHPMHVQSVAWVAERRDVLSGLFFMLTLGAYALYAERPSLSRYLAVAGCLTLGLMSKPMLVTVPFLLLLLDYWPLDRFRPAAHASPRAGSGSWLGRLSVGWRLVVEKIPLVALSALSCGITVWTHLSLRITDEIERLSLATRVANALVSYAAYLGQSFYPVNLSPYYPASRHPPAVRLGDRSTGSAGGDHCGRRVLLAPAALSAGRLALVFGNAGAGHRIGGGLHSSPGRQLYLSEPDRIIDRAGLGCVERLSVTTISPGGAGGVGCSRPYRERRYCCLPPSRGATLPTGAMPRWSGRVRPLARSKICWRTTSSPISASGRARPPKRSPISAKLWQAIRSLGT